MITSVAICIATFRRPEGLRNLLDALGSLSTDGVSITVVVADNDVDRQEGIDVCESMEPQYPWPIETTIVENPGIPYPRNAAIEIALERGVDAIAFLDDDERPPTEWLNELLRVLHLEADLAGGPQTPVFPPDAPELLTSVSYYGHDQGLADGASCTLESSGNFIVRSSALQKHGPPWFDPTYAKTSGADHDLFRRLELAGATMRWAPHAFVWEDIPLHRLEHAWLRERVVEIHNGRVRIDRQHYPERRFRALTLAKTCALGVHATVLTAMAKLRGTDTLALDAQLLRWKLEGKLAAHRGKVVDREEDRPNPLPTSDTQ